MRKFKGNDDELVVTESTATDVVPVAQKKTAPVVVATNGVKPEDMYNQMMKKVYVFDESGSMKDQMAIDPVEGVEARRESKSSAMKRVMRTFIESRFKKYPNSLVSVLGFATESRVLCQAGSNKEKVLAAVDQIEQEGGGTDILKGIQGAISNVAQSPSPLNLNQIIFITDGMSYTAREVGDLLADMKKLNIVFDFIYVNSKRDTDFGRIYNSDGIAELKKLCEATGGEYFEVSKMSDFEQKFFAVSNRLALPPAR